MPTAKRYGHNRPTLDDLRIPPANRREALKGKRTGQHSIRINQQWRICFVWHEGQADQCRDRRRPLAGAPMTELANIHPGEILLEEFLEPMELSQNRLARAIDVPPRRINEIVLGKRAISADTAIRFARYFGASEKLWMGLQADYDLEEVHRAEVA